jgi:uncharacterized membrane protein
MTTPPASTKSVSRTQRYTSDNSRLTLAVLGAVADDRVRGLSAGLVRAVTDSVGEVHVLAKTRRIAALATELGRIGEHIVDAGLLNAIGLAGSYIEYGGRR